MATLIGLTAPEMVARLGNKSQPVVAVISTGYFNLLVTENFSIQARQSASAAANAAAQAGVHKADIDRLVQLGINASKDAIQAKTDAELSANSSTNQASNAKTSADRAELIANTLKNTFKGAGFFSPSSGSYPTPTPLETPQIWIAGDAGTVAGLNWVAGNVLLYVPDQVNPTTVMGEMVQLGGTIANGGTSKPVELTDDVILQAGKGIKYRNAQGAVENLVLFDGSSYLIGDKDFTNAQTTAPLYIANPDASQLSVVEQFDSSGIADPTKTYQLLTTKDAYTSKEVDAALADKADKTDVEDVEKLSQQGLLPSAEAQQAKRDWVNSSVLPASGFVDFGQSLDDPEWESINQGLAAPKAGTVPTSYVPNTLGFGTVDGAPTFNCNGIKLKLDAGLSDFAGKWVFPEAPDGTVTFNKTTGEIIQHADAQTAFDYVANAVAPNEVEVVINRVDLFGYNFWKEEINSTNPFFYLYGDIHNTSPDIAGIATEDSNRPDTYYGLAGRGKGVDWTKLTFAEQMKVASIPHMNITIDLDFKVIQDRVRHVTIAGAGNGDWSDYEVIGNKALKHTNTALGTSYVAPQGQLDDVPTNSNVAGTVDGASTGYYVSSGNPSDFIDDIPSLCHKGVFTAVQLDNTGGTIERTFSPAGVNGECYFYVCGVVPRLNQGAWHKSFNPMGSAKATDGAWHESASLTDTLTCFTNKAYGSLAGAASGRPDGKFYDVIYDQGQGGVIDYRMTAEDTGSKEYASKVMQDVVNGSYRGKEYLVKTAVSTPRANATNANSVTYSVNVANGGDVVGGTLTIVNNGQVVTENNPIIEVTGVTDISMTVRVLHPFDRDDYSATGHDIITYQTNIPVSGEFLTHDVIADPSELVTNKDLKEGWFGHWIPVIPETSVPKDYPLVRDFVGTYATNQTSCIRTRTTDGGATWDVGEHGIETVPNAIVAAPFGDTVAILMGYVAKAKQTVPTNAAKAVPNGSESLGGVYYAMQYCQRQFKIDPLIDVIAEVKLTHPRN
ncbi:hypothetical protein QTO01_11190 [Vibrio mytili]|uniref:hypothetical protein n=1 Tax=Vibrio mytili TaxID=50718 RepID=UPI002F409FD2